jgi:hypothetical protein
MTGEESRKPDKPRMVSMDARKSKVDISGFASMPSEFAWYRGMERMIPAILAGQDLRDLTHRIVRAVREKRPVMFMMGAHAVKCGLGGLIADMIARGVVTSVAMNGACAIHDVELALWGRTSEDVAEGLQSGGFGMTKETAEFFARAAARCLSDDRGMGEALKMELADSGPKHRDISIINACSERDVLLTVHVAPGTDVVHQHREADGKAIGHGTMIDFRAFAERLAALDGGIVINIGSAVIMPEVFLKAVAMARSRGVELGNFTTANFDMYSLYRPRINVVERPKLIGGTTFNFLGHHEILLPVLFASILSEMARNLPTSQGGS